jgi:transposase InsO family protein
VIDIYAASKGIYGAPKIAHELNKRKTPCSTSKVARAMKKLGIRSIVSEKFKPRKSSLTDEEKALIVNLVKGLEVNHINQVWTTDVTYIKTKNDGTFYLITFLDQYSKRIVSWDLTKKQTADEVIKILKTAVKNRVPKPGLIIHSDKGSQFRSYKYRQELRQNNFLYSYTSLNHSCDENATQESFHAMLKKECIYQHQPETFKEAYSMIFLYIENFYNPTRIHSAIDYLSPCEFEKFLEISPSKCV